MWLEDCNFQTNEKSEHLGRVDEGFGRKWYKYMKGKAVMDIFGSYTT